MSLLKSWSRRKRVCVGLSLIALLGLVGVGVVRTEEYVAPYRVWQSLSQAIQNGDGKTVMEMSTPRTFADLDQATEFATFAQALLGDALARGAYSVRPNPEWADNDTWVSTLVRGRRTSNFALTVSAEGMSSAHNFDLILRHGPERWHCDPVPAVFHMARRLEPDMRKQVRMLADVMGKHGLEELPATPSTKITRRHLLAVATGSESGLTERSDRGRHLNLPKL